ncbi:MAG: helix-turn-helix transcriptional regulator [Polyangiaceae bacterium]|nr:helix-turn-helix transcriptional regulator [Polyangiaceae bacterium]NUQ77114.1 helix-turn-helix transcriptional regulator [Polyangiaceae bacterium]
MSKESSSIELGQEIRRRREALNWTLSDLAERADLTPNYIGSIENGFRDPSVSTLIALGRAFEIEPGELVGQLPNISPEAQEIARLADEVSPEIRHSVHAILLGCARHPRK